MAGIPYEGTEGAEAGEWFDGVTKFEEEIRERVAELRQARMDLWKQLAFGRTGVPSGGHGLVPTSGGAERRFAPKLGWSTPSEGERGRVQLPVVEGAACV